MGSKLVPEPVSRAGPILSCELPQVFGIAEGLLDFTSLGNSEEVASLTQGTQVSALDEARFVDELERGPSKKLRMENWQLRFCTF